MARIWAPRLRRIGLAPRDKALEIARQMCAGLGPRTTAAFFTAT